MKKLEFLTRVSPKSQLVLKKELRKAAGIVPGSIVMARLGNRQIIIEPFDIKKEMEKVEEIAKKIGKKWPKGLTSVEAIRQERE